MEDTTNESGHRTTGSGQPSGERLVYVMPSDAAMVGAAGDEIDLIELWNVFWESKWLIAGITVLFTLAGTAYALLATEWYRAEVLLMPADEKVMPNLIGQLGGLASLAGISVGGKGSIEPIAVLKSKEFTGKFIEDLSLMTVLLEDEWDAKAGRWKAKSQEDWPDIRDAVRYFEKNVLTVNEDKKTGLVRLSIEWTDAAVAADWANLLVRRLNDRMRERALSEAERNVRYLQEEMAATKVVPLQQSIGRLLESEMQRLMLARGNDEFAFRVIDPGKPPKLRSKPNRILIVLLMFLLGVMVASAGVLVKHSRRSQIRPIAT